MSLPESVALPEIEHQYQTWNNCGPATVAMSMGVVGVDVSQAAAARLLKPDPDDKNVSPNELADYARSQGLEAHYLVDGDLDELRRLLAAGIPVIAEIWFIPEPGDEMGHYVLLVGYDDAAATFLARDSYRGPDVSLPYAEFDAHWRVFNRTLVPVYGPEQATTVATILGERLEPETMYARAVTRALAEVEERGDAFAWFNLGSSLEASGDAAGAAEAFDRARSAGLPWRMLWYQFGPFRAYAETGRWSDVQALAEANLANAPNLEESRYWLGRALEAQGDIAGAVVQYELAVNYNPLFEPPREALARLESG